MTQNIRIGSGSDFQTTLMKLAVLFFAIFTISSLSLAAGKPNSKFGGVQIGAITYSYRSMADQSADAVLNYAVESGLSSIELMGDVAERFAGIPQSKDPEVIKKWRTTVSMDKFKALRKKYSAKGVKIHILKLGDKMLIPRWWASRTASRMIVPPVPWTGKFFTDRLLSLSPRRAQPSHNKRWPCRK